MFIVGWDEKNTQLGSVGPMNGFCRSNELVPWGCLPAGTILTWSKSLLIQLKWKMKLCFPTWDLISRSWGVLRVLRGSGGSLIGFRRVLGKGPWSGSWGVQDLWFRWVLSWVKLGPWKVSWFQLLWATNRRPEWRKRKQVGESIGKWMTTHRLATVHPWHWPGQD